MSFTFRYSFIKGELEKRRARRKVLRVELDALESDITLLESWVRELSGYMCYNCDGSGMIKLVKAQDDIKAAKCEVCGGTGISERVS